MGEALISRSSGGVSDGDITIPVTPGYHTVLVTLKDSDGAIMGNYPITCKDGTQTYSYTTNEKGQSMFMCNSGAANIFVNNYNGSAQYLDISSKWTNIDAPVGMTSKINIDLNRGNTFYEFTANKQFIVLRSRNIANLILVGGGGGGGSGICDSSDHSNDPGAGGGAGYLNQYNNIVLNGNEIYQFYAGPGGRGGFEANGSVYDGENGATGGTSYIANTSYSAIGGAGGEGGGRAGDNGGKGGLGDGGNCDSRLNGSAGKNSSVNFAGGGGGGGGVRRLGNGGSPYGGRGATNNASAPDGGSGRGANGSRGGGGGGGCGIGWGYGDNARGGTGGAGLMRINFQY